MDLENLNPKDPPNFLNVKLEGKNTNWETLRLIKHSFVRIGNHIEANRFFVMEMNRYREELQAIYKRDWSLSDFSSI